MPTTRLVTRVWIAPGCIVCDVCVTICPEVFVIEGETCRVRPEALVTEFNKPRTGLIIEAAERCPVDVIELATVEVDASEAPPLIGAAEAESPAGPTRRTVLATPALGWIALAGSAAVSGLALQRFMMPNVVAEPDPRVPIGDLERYAALPFGAVDEVHRREGIVVIRLSDRIAALSTTCTHLGCLVNWSEGERKFKCPCHGSGFTQDGINVEGPAPRPLERFGMVVEDGQIIVDRRHTFRHERGEWNNPQSFIIV